MQYNILVADDERLIADTLVAILNRSGFMAWPCYSAKDAIALATGIHFDLVLLDVHMPDAHGLEHAIAVRDNCRCDVLLISGQASTADFLTDLETRGIRSFDIIAKPIHPRELIETIHEIIGRGKQASQAEHEQTGS